MRLRTLRISCQSEPLLGCLVPIEMREDYRSRRGSHISSSATNTPNTLDFPTTPGAFLEKFVAHTL